MLSQGLFFVVAQQQLYSSYSRDKRKAQIAMDRSTDSRLQKTPGSCPRRSFFLWYKYSRFDLQFLYAAEEKGRPGWQKLSYLIPDVRGGAISA